MQRPKIVVQNSDDDEDAEVGNAVNADGNEEDEEEEDDDEGGEGGIKRGERKFNNDEDCMMVCGVINIYTVLPQGSQLVPFGFMEEWP